MAGLFGGLGSILSFAQTGLSIWDMFSSKNYQEEMDARNQREKQKEKEEDLLGAKRNLLEEYYSTTASSQGMEHTFVSGVNQQYNSALGRIYPEHGAALDRRRKGGNKGRL
jgi:hypothetical protein